MSQPAAYRVRFETDQEADSPQQAAILAWEDLRADDSTADLCTVTDPETGRATLIDLSAAPAPLPPLPADAKTFRYASKVNVTFEVTAGTEAAAFALLDYTCVQVRAFGDPIRQRLARVAATSIDDGPELLPDYDDSPEAVPDSSQRAQTRQRG